MYYYTAVCTILVRLLHHTAANYQYSNADTAKHITLLSMYMCEQGIVTMIM